MKPRRRLRREKRAANSERKQSVTRALFNHTLIIWNIRPRACTHSTIARAFLLSQRKKKRTCGLHRITHKKKLSGFWARHQLHAENLSLSATEKDVKIINFSLGPSWDAIKIIKTYQYKNCTIFFAPFRLSVSPLSTVFVQLEYFCRTAELYFVYG